MTAALPCPAALYLRALAGELQAATPGDVAQILRALRRVLTDVDYTLARLGPEAALERDALIWGGDTATHLRRHVLALHDRYTDAVAWRNEEIPS